MKTNAKVSTANKSARKSVKNVAVAAGVSSSAVAAVAAAAVAVSATSSERAKAIDAGLAAPAAVAAGRASAVASAVLDEDVKISAFRQKVASRWASPLFELSDEFNAVSSAVAGLPADMQEKMLLGARRAWAARPENAATTATVADVCDELRANYAKEFKTLCGCAVPAAEDVRIFSRSSLNLSTITAESDINDYLTVSAVSPDLSPSALVAAVMSIRHKVTVTRARAAAVAGARSELFAAVENCARMALRLGVGADVLARYMSLKMAAVPASNAVELARLRRNLSNVWAACKRLEADLVLAGCAGGIEIDGGFVFPASLPASCPAKVRKLWEKRKKYLSSIRTLEGLIARG